MRATRRAQAKSWLVPATVVALALAARITVIAADTGYRPQNDAYEYDYIARSIAAGDGYPQSGYLLQGGPTAIRGPAYPYLLGGVYAVSGDSRTAGRLAGAALGALAVLLIYLIAGRIWGRRTGLIAALLAAAFPPLVLISRDLLSEPLFVVLELAALLGVLEFRRSGGKLSWAAAAGGLCGAAILTRNTGVVVLLAVAVGLFLRRPAIVRSLVAPGLAVACAALVILPWTIRNAAEFGQLVPVTTSAGFGAAGTYNEQSLHAGGTHGAWRNPQTVPDYRPLFTTAGLDEADVDAKLRARVRHFAWQHPGYVAEVSGWNLLRMFEVAGGSVVDANGRQVNQRGIGSAVPASERVGLALAGALAVLGLLAILGSESRELPGGGRVPRVPRGPLFLWLVPVLMILTAMPVAGLPRYRLPSDPFLLTLAAIGTVWLGERLNRRRGGAA